MEQSTYFEYKNRVSKMKFLRLNPFYISWILDEKLQEIVN